MNEINLFIFLLFTISGDFLFISCLQNCLYFLATLFSSHYWMLLCSTRTTESEKGKSNFKRKALLLKNKPTNFNKWKSSPINCIKYVRVCACCYKNTRTFIWQFLKTFLPVKVVVFASRVIVRKTQKNFCEIYKKKQTN